MSHKKAGYEVSGAPIPVNFFVDVAQWGSLQTQADSLHDYLHHLSFLHMPIQPLCRTAHVVLRALYLESYVRGLLP